MIGIAIEQEAGIVRGILLGDLVYLLYERTGSINNFEALVFFIKAKKKIVLLLGDPVRAYNKSHWLFGCGSVYTFNLVEVYRRDADGLELLVVESVVYQVSEGIYALADFFVFYAFSYGLVSASYTGAKAREF